MTKQVDIRHIFDQILKDFESDLNPTEELIPWRGSKGTYTVREYRISQDPKYRVRDPYLIFIIFVQLKQYKFKGRDEKVAWTIPIKYKGEPFLLTLRKFGFQIIGKKRKREITSLGREAMYKIYKSMPYAETLVQPAIKQQVQAGKITLDNHYNEILGRYRFFKRKATEEFKKGAKPRYKTTTPNEDFGGIILVSTTTDLSAKNRMAGNNYGVAMLDSYFSMLEHLLVLMLPFIQNLDYQKIDVEEFLLQNWKEKIKFIIPLADPKAGKLFEQLLAIKENLRNPLTHGHFQKNGHSIFVHMPWVGAIPMNLSKSEKHFTYSWNAIFPENFNSIVKCFEDFLEYLEKGETTLYAMKYIKSGLSIAFDKNSRERYLSAMADMSTFDSFLEYEMMDYTNAMNMDW
jgi:hypothetical protein